MNDEINYMNHPLQGVGLEQLVTEIVDHYGFEILFAYLNINCFKTNPSIKSSVKFLKKTDWAREKVEAFYMYQYKNLPRASSEQFEIPPRDRIIPEGQVPGEPAKLSLEDAERLQEKRAKKAAEYRPNKKQGSFDKKRAKLRDSGPFQKQTADKQKPVCKQEPAARSAPKSSGSKPSKPKPSNSSDPWSKWRE